MKLSNIRIKNNTSNKWEWDFEACKNSLDANQNEVILLGPARIKPLIMSAADEAAKIRWNSPANKMIPIEWLDGRQKETGKEKNRERKWETKIMSKCNKMLMLWRGSSYTKYHIIIIIILIALMARKTYIINTIVWILHHFSSCKLQS